MSLTPQTLLADLEFNRKRLAYYEAQLTKLGGRAPTAITRWVEIYSERVSQLDRKLRRLQSQGMRTELKVSQSAKRSARA